MADETPESPFRHRVQVTLDETTGEVACRHYTDVEFGRGGNVRTSSTNRDVVLTKAAQRQLRDLLQQVIDGNREAMEDQADADSAQLHHLTSTQREKTKLAKLSLSSNTTTE